MILIIREMEHPLLSHTSLNQEANLGLTYSLVAQTARSLPAVKRPRFDPWDRENPMDKGIFSNPLHYSCLGNSISRGAWCPWGHKESDTTERLTLEQV